MDRYELEGSVFAVMAFDASQGATVEQGLDYVSAVIRYNWYVARGIACTLINESELGLAVSARELAIMTLSVVESLST